VVAPCVVWTGGSCHNTYCFVCEFRDGRLIQVTEYMDTDLALRVLGVPDQAPA